MTLTVAPITLAEANAYVQRFHRHNGRLPSAKFAVACVADELVVGIGIAGLPKARLLCDGGTLEINRVCTDGSRNACSKLYAACARAARALGYWRLVTYTVQSEDGASLRASGWTRVGDVRGGTWARPNQQRTRTQAKDAHDLGAKTRWEITFADGPTVFHWPEIITQDNQGVLDFGDAS